MHDMHSTKESWHSAGASLWQKMTFGQTCWRKLAKKKVSGLQHESLLTFEWKHHNTDAKCVYNVWGTDELIFPFLFLSSRRAERRGIISHSLFFLWLYFHLIFYITHSLSDITHKPVKPTTMPSNAVINTTAFKGSDYADSPGKRMVRNTRQM